MNDSAIPYTPIPRDKALVAVDPEPAPKTVYEHPRVASGWLLDEPKTVRERPPIGLRWLADATRQVRHTARIGPHAGLGGDSEGV